MRDLSHGGLLSGVCGTIKKPWTPARRSVRRGRGGRHRRLMGRGEICFAGELSPAVFGVRVRFEVSFVRSGLFARRWLRFRDAEKFGSFGAEAAELFVIGLVLFRPLDGFVAPLCGPRLCAPVANGPSPGKTSRLRRRRRAASSTSQAPRWPAATGRRDSGRCRACSKPPPPLAPVRSLGLPAPGRVRDHGAGRCSGQN